MDNNIVSPYEDTTRTAMLRGQRNKVWTGFTSEIEESLGYIEKSITNYRQKIKAMKADGPSDSFYKYHHATDAFYQLVCAVKNLGATVHSFESVYIPWMKDIHTEEIFKNQFQNVINAKERTNGK